jgi:MoxR-like ATPase
VPRPRCPYYAPQGERVRAVRALGAQLPLLIKGPTGCGKTRFVEHMAARLGRPLITVSCHDDLSAADLVGRHLIGERRHRLADGPLTRAVRSGAICYLDEVVEARKDTTVVLHPLADDRRVLPIERTGELLVAPTRLHAGHQLQPRLPEPAEEPEAQHAPALRGADASATRRRRWKPPSCRPKRRSAAVAARWCAGHRRCAA